MGFFGRIPATELKARYNTVAKRLILIASGETKVYTSAITFQREQFLGGLKYSLNGWIGPITGAEQAYNHTQSFAIELPDREIFPSNTVVFVTANHPNGKVVDIEYFIGEPLPSESSDSAPVIPASDASGINSSDEQLRKLFKIPFEITASSEPQNPLGSVTVEFDRNHLELTDAAITAGKQITWTFNSLQTGTTQIIVTTRGGGGTEEVSVMKYDVYIYLPTLIHGPIHPTPALGKNAGTAPADVPTDSDDPHPVDEPNRPPHIPLSWLGFINIGINILQRAYPLGVELLEVDATPLIPGPVSNPAELNQLKIVARIKPSRETADATAILRSTGWGEFGSIQTTPLPRLGDVVIEWPIKMDIIESFKLLLEAGFKDPVAVTLRQPLYPGLEEPYYIYAFENGLFVGVGVKDGKVEEFGSGNLGFATGT